MIKVIGVTYLLSLIGIATMIQSLNGLRSVLGVVRPH